MKAYKSTNRFAGYLTLLSPALLQTPEEVQSGEEEDLARYAHKWQKELLAMPVCKGRVIKVCCALSALACPSIWAGLEWFSTGWV
jgi:hypothetical protein